MSHYMLSAPAGAGKTRTLCTTAVLLATQGSSAMLVSPTKRLTDQTARDIRAELSRRNIHIEPGVIYGCDEAEGSVSARLTERLRAHRSSPIPGILLATHEGSIDPVGVIWLDEQLERQQSSVSRSYAAAADGACAADLPAYRLSEQTAAWISGLLPRMSHFDWLEPPLDEVLTHARGRLTAAAPIEEMVA